MRAFYERTTSNGVIIFRRPTMRYFSSRTRTKRTTNFVRKLKMNHNTKNPHGHKANAKHTRTHLPCSNFLATDLYRIVWQAVNKLLNHSLESNSQTNLVCVCVQTLDCVRIKFFFYFRQHKNFQLESTVAAMVKTIRDSLQKPKTKNPKKKSLSSIYFAEMALSGKERQ